MKKKTSSELALDLGRSMAELRNYVRQFVQVKIREHGISITFEMLEVMSCLWRQDGINQQEIADFTLRDKSSMTYLLDNLVKRDLVQRREDETDRRNKLIYLTEAGKMLKQQLQPWVAEVYTKATQGIKPAELATSLKTVTQMVDNLKNVP
jgi:DNA-binding MarR family transcriptional regulator